jgi:hypothetical protein
MGILLAKGQFGVQVLVTESMNEFLGLVGNMSWFHSEKASSTHFEAS